MLSQDGDGAQTVTLALKETQFLAARSIHAGRLQSTVVFINHLFHINVNKY